MDYKNSLPPVQANSQPSFEQLYGVSLEELARLKKLREAQLRKEQEDRAIFEPAQPPVYVNGIN